MSAQPSRVFTIAPDKPFLDVLARAVLNGFPRQQQGKPDSFDLAHWTILLPTRRAVRELEDIFFRLTGGTGLLLPRIKPIGDIDEDLLAPAHDVEMPETPLTAPGQLLLLIDLIDQWAGANPHTRLAQEIAAAPQQAKGLAQSLAELLDTLETEDVDPTQVAELYGLEAARHREAILDFLAIARESYPRRLREANVIGPQARRSMILRREAARLAFTKTDKPFIAAGSTGSIKATAALLQAIAGLPNGAVVLPGLDQVMDEPSWLAVGPTHPQHAIKHLLSSMGLPRQAVAELGEPAAVPRNWLLSEMMRPAETAHLWREGLAGRAAAVSAAMTGVELVETRSLQEQAAAAALILRQCLETPGRTGCLITPERQLARRVKAELQRWNIAIDDSAGEPLIRMGGGSLVNLLMEAQLDSFSAESLAALLHHPLATFGAAADEARAHASLIDMALLRAGTGAPGIGALSHAMRLAAANTQHRHLALRPVTSEQWDAAALHCARISDHLTPLQASQATTLAAHLDLLTGVCEAIAGEAFWQDEGGDELRGAFDVLREESRFLASCDAPRAAAIIRHWLQGLPVRRQATGATAALSILGLLEARLIRADVMVLAGLNESTWPGVPDSGPWVNRPMRDTLGLKQPESQIGQTAHDFVQAFGAADVKLLWSRRIGDSPATLSRWIHRLQMILKAAGLDSLTGASAHWPLLARQMIEPGTVVPIAMPKPRPPVKLRPRQLSVTRIESLIRDPYAIYARHVLRLEPLDPVSAAPDSSRRGMIFHAAIGDFLAAYPRHLPDDAEELLLAAGKVHFAALADYPGLTGFWWPRFQRIAHWLAEQEFGLRAGVESIAAERAGALRFDVIGEPFALTCRADRVDLFADGSARIIDYKTGTPPSAKQVIAGLNPQLTLQAAILAAGGFDGLQARTTRELAYIKLSGGVPAGEIVSLKLGQVMDLAAGHLAGVKRMLTGYANPGQPYLPRAMMEKDDEASDYDHLSRFREWSLSGSRS